MTKEELERKMREHTIVKVERLTEGHTRGKQLLTLSDGTQLLFKPAHGGGPSTNPPVVTKKEDRA